MKLQPLPLLATCADDVTGGVKGWSSASDWSLLRLLQIVGPADGSSYIVDYYGARLTRLTITNDTYRKPHLAL